MKNVFGHVLMAPDADGGAGGGADNGKSLLDAGAGGGSDGKGADDKGGGQDDGASGSLLDEGGAGDGGGADGKGGGKRDDGASGSLLAGDGEGDGDGGGKKDEGAPPEATPEQIDAYLAKIKKIDFSDGEAPAPAWDDGALKTVAPLFIKHKIGDEAANEIIAAYGRHVAGQYKAAADADRQVLTGLRAECSKRFGGDIRRFASEGRRGGEHVFGKELFSRLARVEAFGSDPDIIEALAKIGRGLTTDGAAGGGAGGKTEKSLAERMYPKGK